MNRRIFSNEFKSEAIRLANSSGVTKSQVARELGIRPELLYRWISDFGNDTKLTPARSLNEHDELIKLRRVLSRVTEERDILKKALGIFTPKLP